MREQTNLLLTYLAVIAVLLVFVNYFVNGTFDSRLTTIVIVTLGLNFLNGVLKR